MIDHIGDANKMVSETPRMKAAQMAAMEHGTGDVWRVGCDIERELNAANDRIRQLSVLLGTEDPTTAAEILKTLIRGMEDARKLSKQVKAKQRQIKRLEEAGDEILRDNQDMANVNRWWKAKEAKP